MAFIHGRNNILVQQGVGERSDNPKSAVFHPGPHRAAILGAVQKVKVSVYGSWPFGSLHQS
jgi:hypothetical protein